MNNFYTDNNYLHVAIGVICRGYYSSKNVLISQRAANVHLGGLWEFPGGKIEQGESIIQALHREIKEELGISITKAEPLISIPCQYPEINVLLEVWTVSEFKGRASAKEKQPIKWISQAHLGQINFPDINTNIINAINLPDSYVITKDIDLSFNNNSEAFIQQFKTQCQRGHNLFQLRFKETDFNHFSLADMIQQLFNIAHAYHVKLQVNSFHLETLEGSKIESQNLGVHLSSSDLDAYDKDKLTVLKRTYKSVISASCHCQQDIIKANQLNLDFIVLSPINKTESHPQAEAIGWEKFKQLTQYAQMPVYALGGMGLMDIEQAKYMGAQGIAGINCFAIN
jgi:8-oxo-dGTP diphosphatase